MNVGTLAEYLKIVPVGQGVDVNVAAENDCDSLNMRDYHTATFVIMTGTMDTATAYVKAYSGATEGTKTTAIPFRYAFGGAAIGTAVAGSTASCDVLAAWAWATASTGVAIPIANDNYLMVVEVNAQDMDAGATGMANDTHDWLTLTFADTDTGATGIVDVIAILQPRYTGNRSATALK